jgi:F-type H+-transporting ATPase subunit delta
MENVYVNYATAFYELALSSKRPLDDYLAAMRAIAKDFSAQPEFLKLLSSYTVDKKALHAIAEKVFASYGLPYLCDFMKVLIDHHRIDRFLDVEQAFASLVNENLGVDEGVLYSAKRLSESEQYRIEQALSQRLSKKISLTQVVDPNLLGGVKVALGGKVYDGTLRNRLDDLRKQLLNGRLQ